jgi:hypothetical protein
LGGVSERDMRVPYPRLPNRNGAAASTKGASEVEARDISITRGPGSINTLTVPEITVGT